jgi:pyruvate formate lyase activating enzyme
VDQFLFDVKVMDPCSHERFTGATNGRILENLARLCRIHDHVVVRYPLIPGYNDQASQITSLARHVKGLRGVERIEVLPYHRYGEHKYETLGRDFLSAGVTPPDPEGVDRTCALVRAAGLECRALH